MMDYSTVFGGYQKDVDAFLDLVKVVRARRALALVGAGMSVRASFPSWPKLMRALDARAAEEAARNPRAPDQRPRDRNDEALPSDFRDDVLWQGEVLRTRLEALDRNAYTGVLTATFDRPVEPDRCSTLLAELPFCHFLTTNYERVMFAALQRARGSAPPTIDWTVDEEALRMMHTFLEPGAPPHLVHLHGRIENPQGIVLTDRDYARHYLRSDGTMRKLFALFALNRFVFFGFSLTDPDLMALLRQVAGGLALEGRPRHFAILAAGKGYPRDDVRERLIRKFGVRPVFYENGSGGHEHFEPLMTELVRLVRGEEEPGRVLVSAAGAMSANVPPAMSNMVRKPALPPSAPRSAGAPAPPVAPPVAPPRTAGVDGPVAAPPDGGGTVHDADRQNPDHPDDPRKGMYGGRDENGGVRLTATVAESDESGSWFDIVLTVRSTTAAPLTGTVVFCLHDTFLEPVRTVAATDGAATLALSAYGAFTVGALAKGPGVELELDLASLPDAPREFRER